MKIFKVLLLVILSFSFVQAFADNRQHYRNVINTSGMSAGTGVVTAIATGQVTLVLVPGQLEHRINFPLHFNDGYIVVDGSTQEKQALPPSCKVAIHGGETLTFQGEIFPGKKPNLSCLVTF